MFIKNIFLEACLNQSPPQISISLFALFPSLFSTLSYMKRIERCLTLEVWPKWTCAPLPSITDRWDPLVAGLIGKRRKREEEERKWVRPRSAAHVWIRPSFHSWTRIPDGSVPEGHRWGSVSGCRWDRMVEIGWIGIQASLNRLFHAGLVFIPRRPDPRGMDLVLGRSERTERGLRWWMSDGSSQPKT